MMAENEAKRLKIVVAAWIGSRNLGDELIFHALVKFLVESGIPRADITAISTDPARTERTFGVHAVSHVDLPALLRAMRSCDVVIFGGGGLVQDATSALNLPYHLSRVWLARMLNKPVAAIGIGVGPLDTRIGRWLARKTFSRVDDIIVRDDASHALLLANGVDHAKVGMDIALSLPGHPKRSRSCIAACLRPYSPKSRLLPVSWRSQEHDESHVCAIARALDEASRRVSLPVRFIAFDEDKDVEFHHAISAKMTTKVTHASVSVETVFENFNEAAVVVATRYHAGIVAALTESPCLLIGYSPKVESLSLLLGPACRLIPNDPGRFAEMPGLIESLACSQEDATIAMANIADSWNGCEDLIHAALDRARKGKRS